MAARGCNQGKLAGALGVARQAENAVAHGPAGRCHGAVRRHAEANPALPGIGDLKVDGARIAEPVVEGEARGQRNGVAGCGEVNGRAGHQPRGRRLKRVVRTHRENDIRGAALV